MLLCPGELLDKNSGVGCHFLFQLISYIFFFSLNFNFILNHEPRTNLDTGQESGRVLPQQGIMLVIYFICILV